MPSIDATTDASSQQFLDFARSGNPAALERALEGHVDRVYAQSVWILGNANDAEDAVQDALVRLVRTAHRYDGSVPFVAWLAQLTHAASLNLYRSRRQRQHREARAAGELTASLSVEGEAIETVRQEIARLPEQHRFPLDLHYFAGLSIDDTASALGVSPDAAVKRIQRARSQLEIRLRRHGITAASIAALTALVSEQAHAGATVRATSTLAANAMKAAAIPVAGHGVGLAAAGLLLAGAVVASGFHFLKRSDAVPRLEYLDGSEITIDGTKLVPDGGNGFWIYQSAPTGGDTVLNNRVSSLRLFENGKELGPAHALHKDIRDLGNGRFSHWEDEVACGIIFSTSDNTDPRTNGRTYTYVGADADAAVH